MIRIKAGKFGFVSERLRLYCLDLEEKIPEVETGIDVEFKTGDRSTDTKLIKKSIVDERLSRGDLLFLARHKSDEVGCIFASTEKCWVGEIEIWFSCAEREIYLYDAFTTEDFRGRHVYPFLISEASRYFKERNFRFALIFTTVSNTSSIKGIERAGSTCYQMVDFLNIPGLRIWRFHARCRDVKSRFANEI